jgi:crotonobetainyl-CoA:carnitine CoA-transferase CaiB-like acyl-CoA transferase
VQISGDRLATSIRSERSFRMNGELQNAWAPLSGFFRTADGWVRAHGNYPHHAARLRAILGVADDAAQDVVAAAFRAMSAQDVEDRAAESGAIAVRVRTPEEWALHPQSAALAATPLIQRHSLPFGPPRGWAGGLAARPLDGVRILDLTRVIAGPVASRDLAFAGADVLRIDSPMLPEIPWQHLDTGQGKRSTVLDLTSKSDRAQFEELLTQADAVITGYRPGALTALGLSPEALAERRPGIIVGSVSAWGTTGPWSGRRGFDSIVQAASGIGMIESDDGEKPGALPAQALDHSAGHFLAAGLTLALVEGAQSGKGAAVDVALARIAQELVHGDVTIDKRLDSGSPQTVQVGRSGDTELITAAPVLTYAGAPDAYPEFGGTWAADPAEWPSGSALTRSRP